jgi:hypothetical protein
MSGSVITRNLLFSPHSTALPRIATYNTVYVMNTYDRETVLRWKKAPAAITADVTVAVKRIRGINSPVRGMRIGGAETPNIADLSG